MISTSSVALLHHSSVCYQSNDGGYGGHYMAPPLVKLTSDFIHIRSHWYICKYTYILLWINARSTLRSTSTIFLDRLISTAPYAKLTALTFNCWNARRICQTTCVTFWECRNNKRSLLQLCTRHWLSIRGCRKDICCGIHSNRALRMCRCEPLQLWYGDWEMLRVNFSTVIWIVAKPTSCSIPIMFSNLNWLSLVGIIFFSISRTDRI